MVENRSRPNDWNLRCRHTIRVVFSFSPVCLAVLVYCVETGFQFWLNLVGSSVLCFQSSVCQLFTFFCSPCDNPRPVIQFLLLRKLMKNRTKPSVWLFEFTQLNLVWFWVSFTFCQWDARYHSDGHRHLCDFRGWPFCSCFSLFVFVGKYFPFLHLSCF